MNLDRVSFLVEIATNNALMVFNRNLGFEEEAGSYEGIVMSLVYGLAYLDDAFSEYHEYQLLKDIGALELYREGHVYAQKSRGEELVERFMEMKEEDNFEVVF